MTIEQAVSCLLNEKQEKIESRFPCRAIMVKNVQQYIVLLSELKKIPDIQMISSAELFSSGDVMPRYENLEEQAYWDRWLILPGVSEYLRLFSKSEAASQRFAKLWGSQVSATSRGRILIPLWGCEAQWHDRTLHLCDDIRREEHYFDCVDQNEDEQQLDIVVFSGDFEQYTTQLEAKYGHICAGLQEWYEYWAEPVEILNEQAILTKRHMSIQPTTGNITVKVIRDRLSFISEGLSGARDLTEEDCPEQAQALLFDYSLHGFALDKAILSALNSETFIGTDIMSRWISKAQGKKQLAILWITRHPDDTYLYYCVNNSSSIEDIPNHITHDIFGVYNTHPHWIKESQDLIDSMEILKDEKYYLELDEIPVYEKRLEFLSSNTKNDRIYLLRLVGRWMREDAAQVLLSEHLPSVYPELYAYLDGSVYDDDLAGYFSRYKAYKLENTLPLDEELYFASLQPDDYDYRYPVLSSMLVDNSFVLWIDALGAEWLPLLVWTLKTSGNGIIKETTVVQASLPTETCFNEQWNQMDIPYDKLDRLDKLAHKGVVDDPDYYTCIEDQLAFVAGLSKDINELVKKYQRVIVTGDHGTSRLAARFFHRREGESFPKGATICSHGRYCRLPDNAAELLTNTVNVKDRNGTHYAVFTNYDHFRQSGFAAGADDENAIYGEVHGGATPEERLVPVVVFDSNIEIPLTASWKSDVVKVSAKKVKAILEFSRPVNSLQAKIGSIDGVCNLTDKKNIWNIEFSSVIPNTYNVLLVADGAIVQADPLTVKPALGGGEGDLP